VADLATSAHDCAGSRWYPIGLDTAEHRVTSHPSRGPATSRGRNGLPRTGLCPRDGCCQRLRQPPANRPGERRRAAPDPCLSRCAVPAYLYQPETTRHTREDCWQRSGLVRTHNSPDNGNSPKASACGPLTLC